MNSVYLHRKDIKTIMDLFQHFSDHDTVEITSDTSSGIGSVILAHFHDAKLFGGKCTVTFTICDESDW